MQLGSSPYNAAVPLAQDPNPLRFAVCLLNIFPEAGRSPDFKTHASHPTCQRIRLVWYARKQQNDRDLRLPYKTTVCLHSR